MKEELELAVKKELLLKSAARLYSLGIDLEAAHGRVKKLAESGAAYDSPEMLQAIQEYTDTKALWGKLEQEHLALRDEILRSGN